MMHQINQIFQAYWQHYVDFNQTTTNRRSFWTMWLLMKAIDVIALILIFGSLLMLGLTSGHVDVDSGQINHLNMAMPNIVSVFSLIFIFIVWKLVTFIPNLAILCRRLVDMGCPFAVALALIIIGTASGICSLATFVMAFFPTKDPDHLKPKPTVVQVHTEETSPTQPTDVTE